MSASVSPVVERPFTEGVVCWALAALAFLLASFTWSHYWDEYLYLYSVRYHSPPALLTLEKGLSDGLFPYGFFTGKLGFVTFVWALVAITGDGPLGLAVTRLVFAGLTIGLAAASYQLIRLLTGERQASATALVLLFLPLSLYLGFKTLSEVPSLLLATIACWQFLASLQTESTRATHGHVLVAATALALASLFRFTTVLFFSGLVLALLVVPYDRLPRRAVAARAVVIIGLHLVLVGIVYAVLVGSPIERFQGLVASVTGRERGLLMKVYALTLTLQLFALPFAVALFRRWTRASSFAAVWLAVCTVPVLFASSYIEPRYFYMALLPAAMIISTGLCVFSERLGLGGVRGALALLAVLVLGNRLAFAPLMPYEINEDEYSRL